ncbi:hypothetical protein [Psychrobacter sp. DAB_AL43B]|uniref:hypothetical protein n=1 Tax=Psychrobacter sp. DAB_AL43B TaxID=1028416 RepID=UPI0009A85F0F|nr:hypothetical protein [Psychrobacter sp. DAB_AL43B]SLJ84513.1 hypothetical protein DABAL43B_1317 [Psychrobacter sp. DAB_AL43B]
MKIKIKLRWLWLICTALIAMCYPLSVQAATLVQKSDLSAPFIFSWLGVWVFSGAGGLGASFIVVDDIDAKLRHPVIAKFVIGLFWGVGICLLIDALTGTPQGALTFFALAVSSFATPSTAGAMVWLSNQKRINKALDKGFKMKTGIDLSDTEDDK